jgi:hypothetical protein
VERDYNKKRLETIPWLLKISKSSSNKTSCWHFLLVCFMPGSDLNDSYSSFALIIILKFRYYYCLSSIDEETGER